MIVKSPVPNSLASLPGVFCAWTQATSRLANDPRRSHLANHRLRVPARTLFKQGQSPPPKAFKPRTIEAMF